MPQYGRLFKEGTLTTKSKVIVRHHTVPPIPARTITTYQCSVCRGFYRNLAEAEHCASLPLQPQKFKNGDTVTLLGGRECSRRHYYTEGRIVIARGPVLVEEDTNIRLLGGVLRDLHVWEYIVEWTCPICNEEQSNLFYEPQLKAKQ